MRKLIMWNLVTLDGYFEGAESWDLGFHEYAWGTELEQFSIEQGAEIGTLLFGRVTYEGMAAHWTTAEDETDEITGFMNAVPKVVVSTTLSGATWNNSSLVREDPVQAVEALKRQPGNDVFVFGSADLSATLMQHGLFDEYRLCVVPVMLGEGNPLFKPGLPRQRLQLTASRQLQTGSMILTYRPAGTGEA